MTSNQLIINQSSASIPRKFLGWWHESLIRELKRKSGLKSRERLSGELVVVFMDPAPAKQLNKEYRGKEYATDVLSFESDDPESLGELIICPQVIKKQAKDHGLLFREELAYMLTHGVLHLLGYDHETSQKDAEEMFSLQDKTFEKLLSKYSETV